ncbi:MAG: AAA family ATPase [Candidatus Liptonbacteria bacterium]|nr:AAA family ATPase [Candidatus Liptonbacteria bacterium]
MAHLLKRLELNGFKSFAAKTLLDLPSGITAIVGPNGSGKSNIIDAIRWLLGEREAKSLRGGKSEDLIFAGTEKKARMGLAQASLHFENLHLLKTRKLSDSEEQSGIWSSGAAEVTVSRQVNRDGNNQYFLNKSEVRLRDLIDFFAQARLGSKGLSVITQGNSDLFIRVSPRERREMVEEILGLREFQIKKNDAERRLKNSEINLEKVSALIEEILPHLRSLKRQTGKWEKRGSLEEELKTLENNFFGYRKADIERELKTIEDELLERGKTQKDLEKNLEEADKRLKDLEESQPEEKKIIGEIKQQTNALLEKRSLLQKDLGRLEAQIEITSEAKAQDFSVPPEKLLALTKKVRDELGRIMDQDEATLRSSVKNLLTEIDSLLSTLEKKPATASPKIQFSEKFEKLQKDLEGLEAEMLALKTEEKRLEKGQEAFYESFKKEMSESRSTREKSEKWAAETRGREIGRERLTMRSEELVRQISQIGRHPDEFKESSGQFNEAELTAMDNRMFRLRGELASIGEIDEAVLKEAKETEVRYEFLGKESKDLAQAKEDLRKLIKDLNEKIKTDFHKALVHINEEFQKFFALMFDGGRAKLIVAKKEKKILAVAEEGQEAGPAREELPDEEPEEEEGIEVELSLPKKRINSLEMLSGGERSLVGIAALFALISVSPPPFLVLDEVDAPLDERNAKRFAQMLREFSKETQFIVVTHNRATMEAADVLYGVTLGEDGASKIISMKLEK